MIVSLPMYLPGGDAVQSFWAAVAGLVTPRLRRTIPDTPYWPQDLHAHWLEPTLLLSQTCGYPLSTSLRNKVQVVGTIAYNAPGCQGIYCKSQLISRSNDARTLLSQFAGSNLAFNSTDSQSGFNALRALIATTQPQRPFFRNAIQTGGHFASIEKVCAGEADIAAVDCVSLAIWRDIHPQLAKDITVFGETADYPGLPLVTSLSTPPDTLEILRECLAAVATEARFDAVRAPFHICGFEITGLNDYDVCLQMEKAGTPLF